MIRVIVDIDNGQANRPVEADRRSAQYSFHKLDRSQLTDNDIEQLMEQGGTAHIKQLFLRINRFMQATTPSAGGPQPPYPGARGNSCDS